MTPDVPIDQQEALPDGGPSGTPLTPALLQQIREEAICVYLAGEVAEERARKCGTDGRNAFVLSRLESVAHHESSHICIGTIFGWNFSGVTVVPQPDIPVVGGGHVGGLAIVTGQTPTEALDELRSEPAPRQECDGEMALKRAFEITGVAITDIATAPIDRWDAARRIIREQHARAVALVDEHWRQIKYLARELAWRGEMNSEQIQMSLRSALVVWRRQPTQPSTHE